MKKLFALFALLAVSYMVDAAEKVVENPPFVYANSGTIEIVKATLTDTMTVLDVQAVFRPKNWIVIATDTYLKADGKKYMIKSADGIVPGQQFWMPDSGRAKFKLYFEPLPIDTERFDFIESDCGDCFKTWGIELTGNGLPELMLDPQFRSQKLDYKTPLAQPIMAPGKVRIYGRVLDWNPDAPVDFSLILSNVNNDGTSIPLNPQSDGTFAVEFNVPHTTQVRFQQNFIYVSPGENIMVNINKREIARRNSHIHRKSPDYGEMIYTDGTYAALSAEINSVNIKKYLLPYTNVRDRVNGMSLYQYRDFVVSLADSLLGALAQDQAYSNNLKKVVYYAIIEGLSQQLLMGSNALETAYRKANNITDYNKPPIGMKKVDDPDITYFDVFKKYDIDHTDGLAFSSLQELSRYIYYISKTLSGPSRTMICNHLKSLGVLTAEQTKILDDVLNNRESSRKYSEIFQKFTPQIIEYAKTLPKIDPSELYTTSDGVVGDQITMIEAQQQLSNFEPLTDAQLSEFGARFDNKSFAEVLKQANDELIAKIDLNSKKGGYEIIDVADVAPDKLLATIIEKHKGKVLFIDFWATWCGPCRSAMEQAEPVKKQFAGKDVVFIYIASESSPIGTWRNMLPDAPGEHYRMNDDQNRYMSTVEYQYTGIPSYAIIGKDGQKKHFQSGFMGADAMKKMIEKEL